MAGRSLERRSSSHHAVCSKPRNESGSVTSMSVKTPLTENAKSSRFEMDKGAKSCILTDATVKVAESSSSAEIVVCFAKSDRLARLSSVE